MIPFIPRRVVVPAVGAAFAILQLTVASAQTPPSQEKSTLSPAMVRAATTMLDTHIKTHPKSKDAAAAAKKSSAGATEVERAPLLRTPVPAVRAKPKVKKP